LQEQAIKYKITG